MIGLLVLMRRRLNGLDGREILTGVGQALAASLAMSLVLWLWMAQTTSQTIWLTAGAGIALGAGAYALLIFALGVREARGVGKELITRWKRLAP
jgi:peptidoglycan biosynthesis protein MviN/MurJ (putative lipid II flippase)